MISLLGIANSSARIHPAGTVALSRTASVGYSCILASPMATSQDFFTWTPGPLLDSRFLLWAIRGLRDEILSLRMGSTHQTIYRPDIERFRIPVFPRAEQRRIADRLDAATERIDSVVASKGRLIAALRRRATAAIDDVMLGDWPVIRTKHLTSRLTSGPRGWAEYVSDAGTPFIRITNIQRDSVELDMRDTLLVDPPRSAEADRTSTRGGDVLVSITADIGSVAVVPEAMAGAYVSQHVALLTPVRCEPEWLAFALRSNLARDQFAASQYGGTKTQLSLSDVANVRVPVPPERVRAQRLRQLQRALAVTDDSIVRLGQQIELLKEHRQALITAAVTGELEVA